MNYIEFLLWVRGPAFQIAIAVFVFGISLRLLEILLLGRSPEYAAPRGSAVRGGFRTLLTRTLSEESIFRRAPLLIIAGYVFHLGLFIVILLLVPHILVFKDLLGFSWSGLPTSIIDAVAVITLLALFILLINRIKHPVLRFLSTSQDYFAWLITFLPLLTGYMAYHHLINPYPVILGLHILSVEILMVFFPFTKLMHAFTLVMARWYNGANAGHKGVQA
jgi:nitrate reductase gamma subunit